MSRYMKDYKGLGRPSMDLSRTEHTWPTWPAFCEEVTSSMDAERAVNVIYLDFTQSFIKSSQPDWKEMVWISGPQSWWQIVWIAGCQRVVISNAKFSWWLASSGISQGTVLELIVFSVFIKDLDDGAGGQSTLSASSQKIPIWEKQLICWRVVLILRETLTGLQEPHEVQQRQVQSSALGME